MKRRRSIKRASETAEERGKFFVLFQPIRRESWSVWASTEERRQRILLAGQRRRQGFGRNRHRAEYIGMST